MNRRIETLFRFDEGDKPSSGDAFASKISPDEPGQVLEGGAKSREPSHSLKAETDPLVKTTGRFVSLNERARGGCRRARGDQRKREEEGAHVKGGALSSTLAKK